LHSQKFKKLNLHKMYAIVEIAGQQFKVEKNDEIFVHRMEAEPGTKVEFSEVLLVDNNGKISVGKPHVEDSKVTAQVLEHARGDKVIVFKKKRRKGFQKETGHRQDFSKILIESITLKGAAGAAKEKKAKKETAEEEQA
jgi:large subunit ribosomal protein L21